MHISMHKFMKKSRTFFFSPYFIFSAFFPSVFVVFSILNSTIGIRAYMIFESFKKGLWERESKPINFFKKFVFILLASSHFLTPIPSVFSRENYAIWSIKMKTYLQTFDFWEVVEVDKDPFLLRPNLTVVQIKQHSEKSYKKLQGTIYNMCCYSC